jgi:hypothetical protein
MEAQEKLHGGARMPMYFYKHGLLCEGCAQLLMLRLRAQGYGEPPVPNSFVWPEGWDWRPDAQVDKLFCSGCKRWIMGDGRKLPHLAPLYIGR